MGTFNSNILPTTTGLNLGNTVQQWNANLNNVAIGGQLSIKGIPTLGNGVPSIVAAQDFTNQSTAIGIPSAMFLYNVTGTQFYRLTWNAKVTGAASVSSTLGQLNLSIVADDGVAMGINAGAVSQFGTVMLTNGLNNTSTALYGVPLFLSLQIGSNITYNFGYASSPANGMVYEFHIRLEAM